MSLFTVPFDRKTDDWGASLVRDDFLKEIKKYLDWMQIIPHGLYHNGSEVQDWNYSNTRGTYIPMIREAFSKDGLPFVNGFCSPHWRWNEGVALALDDEGWWGAVDRDKSMPWTKKYYRYNYLLNEPFWESDQELLKLHVHIYGTKNDLGRCFNNLLRLDPSTEFVFAGEVLEDR